MSSHYPPEMLSALQGAGSILACTHINPDGDAIGSLLALGELFGQMGKRCTLLSSDGAPTRFAQLPGFERVLTPERLPADAAFDMAVAVDVSELHRMGGALPFFERAPVTAQIDHHPSNPGYAHHNMVDAQAAAAGELVVFLWDALGVPLTREAAFQLYCAICSDTGNFCFDNVRAQTFQCMSRLMKAGLRISEAARRLYLTRQRPHLALLGRAIRSLVYFADGQATCMHLTQEDLRACGAQREHVDRIVNYGLELEGVRMTFLADETDQGWKLSLRALPPCHVGDIAARFGGGGHMLAAGCVIQGDYDQISAAVMRAMEEQLLA